MKLTFNPDEACRRKLSARAGSFYSSPLILNSCCVCLFLEKRYICSVETLNKFRENIVTKSRWRIGSKRDQMDKNKVNLFFSHLIYIRVNVLIFVALEQD